MDEYSVEGEYMSGKELEKRLESGEDEPVLTIDFSTEDEFTEKDPQTNEERKVKKIVLHFTDSHQKVVIGKVIGGGDRKEVLLDNLGKRPAEWKGHKVQLYAKKTSMGPGVMLRTTKEMIKMGTIAEPPF